MTPADRAAWLARVEGMTRAERLMELAHACSAATHTALKAEVDLSYVHPGCDDMDERIAQVAILDAFFSGQRALDLIAALERSAKIEALEQAAEAIEVGAHQGSWSTEMAIARGLKLRALTLRAEAQP